MVVPMNSLPTRIGTKSDILTSSHTACYLCSLPISLYSLIRLVVLIKTHLCSLWSSKSSFTSHTQCRLTSIFKEFWWNFYGAFTKLRKVTISFVISVHPSARMKQLSSHWTDINEMWYLSIFRNSVQKIQVSIKSDRYHIGYFT